MPINPAIPMQVQPPQQQNIIGRLAQVAQLRNAEQQSEMNRMNMDAAKMNQGLQKLKMLSGLAADMRSLPQPERRSRAGRLAHAFEASGNQDLAQMLRSYEWTDQDASDLAALTTDAEAQWNAAEARFKALQGTPSSEIDVGGVAPQNMPLPGSGFTPSQERGPTRSVEVPMPEVQFPAQDGQPAFSMRPQSAQQIGRTKRAATIQEESDKAQIQAAYRQPQQPTGDRAEFLETFLPGYLDEQGLSRTARNELEAWKAYKNLQGKAGTSLPERIMDAPKERREEYFKFLRDQAQSQSSGLTKVYDPVRGEYVLQPRTQGLQLPLPPTAKQREIATNRQDMATKIDSLQSLSNRIITRVGPAQRAAAIVRGAKAVFGSDPEFKTYDDLRLAMGMQLAVSNQGAAQLSDRDVEIWSRLVPNPYQDTSESSDLKWVMIRAMGSLPQRQELLTTDAAEQLVEDLLAGQGLNPKTGLPPETVRVQIQGEPAGEIDADQWDSFKAKYPTAVKLP